jgi:signal transduction histidine kinase
MRGSSGGWAITALILASVMVPTLCVLWFMNEAVASQTAAAGQSALDAYRTQLRFIRRQIALDWQNRASALDRAADEESSDSRLDSGADALVLLDSRDTIAPPAPAAFGGDAGVALATEYIRAGGPGPDLHGLQPTRLEGVWQLASPRGRAIGLYRDETVHLALHRLLDEHQSAVIRFAVFKPDEGAYEEAVAIGPAMPGWQVSFTPLDISLLNQAARSRTASYVWAAVLGIGLVGLVAAGAGHVLRRQLRLTRLETDLVAAVSHELRTPLASMRLLVDGLLRDETLDPSKTREYLGLMAVENARLSRLIDNVLTFSRLDRSRQPLACERIDPATVVEAAVAAARERHPSRTIDVTGAGALPPVDADPDALVTALLNLLDNAAKYSPADAPISVHASEAVGHVLLAVRDRGIGIPAAEQRRIFRRFYQVDRRLARGTSGVGLGLSLVDEILRAHGGTVDVVSEPGAGSTFTMRLPRAAGATA